MDEGERKRLANPWLLKDLRDLVSRYHIPWSKTVLSDDFSARSPAPNAHWKVTTGEFRLDWRYGLRSVAQSPRQQSQPSVSLVATTRRRRTATVRRAPQLGAQKYAAIRLFKPKTTCGQQKRRLRNHCAARNLEAFSFEADITARTLNGSGALQFELALYQGHNRAGYELIIAGEDKSEQTVLGLIRVDGRGAAPIVEKATVKFRFDPETPTTLLWTRHPNDEMEVAIRGTSILRTSDRSFRDAFDGAIIRNRSVDFTVWRMEFCGT